MIVMSGSEDYGIGSTGSDALTFLKSFGTDVVKGAVGAAAAAVGQKVGPAVKQPGGTLPPQSSSIPLPVMIVGGGLGLLLLAQLFRKH